jgi:hypothetical protein
VICGGRLRSWPCLGDDHVNNSEFMKVISDVHSFFQEVSLKIKSNQLILPHAAILKHLCVALEIREFIVSATLKEISLHVSFCVSTCLRVV